MTDNLAEEQLISISIKLTFNVILLGITYAI